MAQVFKEGEIITNRYNGNICVYSERRIDNKGDIFYGMKARYVAKTRSMDYDVKYLPICVQDYRNATTEEVETLVKAMYQSMAL